MHKRKRALHSAAALQPSRRQKTLAAQRPDAQAKNPFSCSQSSGPKVKNPFSFLESLSQTDPHFSSEPGGTLSPPLPRPPVTPSPLALGRKDGSGNGLVALGLGLDDDLKHFSTAAADDADEADETDETDDDDHSSSSGSYKRALQNDDYDIEDDIGSNRLRHISTEERLDMLLQDWEDDDDNDGETHQNMEDEYNDDHGMDRLTMEDDPSSLPEEVVDGGERGKNLLRLLQKPMFVSGAQNVSEDLLDLEWLSANTSTISSDQPKIKSFLDPPFDWTLKSSVSFTSPSPLAWCAAAVTTSQHESRALAEFVSKPCDPDVGPTVGSEKAETEIMPFQTHLYHWVYPSASSSPIQVAAITKLLSKVSVTRSEEVAEMEHFKKIEAEWEKSFQSLYSLLRGRRCAYFYYVSPTFTVLFLSEGMSATGQLEAVLNKSTRGLRRALEKEDIPFEMPLNRSANDDVDANAEAMDADANGDENALVELGKLEELQPGSTRVVQRNHVVGNARRSVLVFRAHMGVHGLFNFLLNWRDNRVEFRSRGPPMLVAPCVFLNATVKQAEITRNGTIRRMTTDPSTNRSVMQILYRIDIDGYILPTSLYSLLLTVARAQDPEERFACALRTDERTEGLNVASEDDSGVKDGDPGNGAANDDVYGMVGWREVVRRRGVKVVMSGTGLDGAAVVGKSEVQVVKCMGGKFEWS